MATKTVKKPKETPKSEGKKREISIKERNRLFNLYVKPNLSDVKNLTKYYTDHYQNFDDNHSYVLEQLWKGVHTYNPEMKLSTWIGIVVRNSCWHENKKRAEESPYWSDIEMCSADDIYQHGNSMMVELECGNLIENISDQMLAALMKIPPQRLSPFMMYAQGMGIREITAKEWELGHLEKRSEDIVKSRIYWAKKELQYFLRQYGITRKNNKGPEDDRNNRSADD